MAEKIDLEKCNFPQLSEFRSPVTLTLDRIKVISPYQRAQLCDCSLTHYGNMAIDLEKYNFQNFRSTVILTLNRVEVMLLHTHQIRSKSMYERMYVRTDGHI